MPIDWRPLLDLIAAHERFVISSHVRPDADAIGSEMGLVAHLRGLGKQVRVINPSATPSHLAFLDPEGLIQKIGTSVSLESACEADVHFIVDTSSWQQLVDVRQVLEKTPAIKVVVDHHLADDLGAREFKDVSASATGVLITELIDAAGATMSVPQAEALFAAVSTDTGWFRFPNADARTYRVAARLIDQGVQPYLVYRQLYERSSLARLKLHAIALARVELACQNRLAQTLVTRKDFQITGALPSDTEELVNSCLVIEGVEAAFILVEQLDGRIKASLRSRSDLNVAAVAEQFSGGGHRQAAGAMLPGPIETAQQHLLKAFDSIIAKSPPPKFPPTPV